MQTRFIRISFFLLFLSQVCTASVLVAQKSHATPASQAKVSSKGKELGDHYLMLVNTAVASLMSEDKFRQFDKSPYDGLAVAFLHAYDTSAPPSTTAIDQQIASWKKITSKDIWPWVYVNRI